MNGIHLSGDLQPMLPKRQQLEDRLRALTHKADIMVFMKGDPEVNIRQQLNGSLDRQQLEDRLRELTHKADIMVFMKGDPEVNIRQQLNGSLGSR